ncbi:MAG: RNA polymerase sigma factor [Haloechinothrix sp.]
MAGDDAALTELVKCLDPLLRSIVARYRLDAADSHDVLQNVWVRFLENRAAIRTPERAIGWLRTTTRREALRVATQWNRQLPFMVDCVEHATPRASSPEDCVLRADRNRSVWRAAGRLDARDRRLAALIAYDSGANYAALAAVIGVMENSVGTIRGRCLVRMRRLLAEEGITDAS